MRLCSSSDRSSTLWISFVIWIHPWGFTPQKNYYTKMFNPAPSPQCLIVVGSVSAVFVIAALEASLDRWWKAHPCGVLAALFLILHMYSILHDSMYEQAISVQAFRANRLLPECAISLDQAWTHRPQLVLKLGRRARSGADGVLRKM